MGWRWSRHSLRMADVMDIEEDCGIASLWEEERSPLAIEEEPMDGAVPPTSSMHAEALRRTTPLFAANCGDDFCGGSCAFIRHGIGNVFHCTVHPGAIHICDMRCKFREVAVSETGAISYRCRISGLVTTKRLLLSTAGSAPVNKRGAEGLQEEHTPRALTGGAFACGFGQRPRFT